VAGELRQEAAHELFERVEVIGPKVVAVHARANKNAWLLGSWAARHGMLLPQGQMGMVGARGLEPAVPIWVVVPEEVLYLISQLEAAG
jgi:hypothetical protein